MASVVGQFVVVKSDTGDGLVAAQVIFTLGALLKRNLYCRNTWEVNINEGQCERNMPGITAAAFISGNIDTNFAFIIESPFLISFRFTADCTGQGAEILIVHGYTTDSHLDNLRDEQGEFADVGVFHDASYAYLIIGNGQRGFTFLGARVN